MHSGCICVRILGENMRRGWIIALLALSGCTSVKGFPEPYVDPEAELKALATYLDPKVITQIKEKRDGEKEAWRNEVIEGRIMADDIRYRQFQQVLYLEATGTHIGTDWVVLGLTGAGALAGKGANVLSAIAAGVTGGRASFDKNAFYDKTMPALLAAMDAKRAQILLRIRQGEGRSIAEYPLTAALNDVAAYRMAGTIPGALTDLTAAAGAASQDAQEKLNALRFDAVLTDSVADEMVKISNYVASIKNNEEDLKKVSAALGVDIKASKNLFADTIKKVNEIKNVKEIEDAKKYINKTMRKDVIK